MTSLNTAVAIISLVSFLNVSISSYASNSSTHMATETAASQAQIPTVESVDLESYYGLWYEVRRIKNFFQDNKSRSGEGPCYNTTAEYSPLPKDKIRVINTCYRLTEVEVAKAKAKAVRGSNNAKLKVNFTGIPFLEWLGIGSGDYWILALGEKNENNLYSWVLVGSPDLKFGWVLARDPAIEQIAIEQALDVAESVGYDRSQFQSFQR